MICILVGKNRLNKNPMPQACFVSGDPITKPRAGADRNDINTLVQPASNFELHYHWEIMTQLDMFTDIGVSPRPAPILPVRPPLESHLLWFISLFPPLFFPGPQLWRRRGDSERMLLLKSEGRRGTSVSLSLASSASPPPPPPPDPVIREAPAWMPSTGLQLHSRPWLPSRLELEGQTLAVSSVEEQETETSLVLSPPAVRASSCCGHPTHMLVYTYLLTWLTKIRH